MAVVSYLGLILCVLVQFVNGAMAAVVQTTNMEDSQSQIMADLNEQYEYCNAPHNKVFNIRHTLSNDTEGLIINPENVTHLMADAYVFRPENIVVPRCDETCKHIDWNGTVNCKNVTVKATRLLSATKKGSEPEYYELHVVEHRECKCIIDGFEPIEIVPQMNTIGLNENVAHFNGFKPSQTEIQIDGLEPNENISHTNAADAKQNDLAELKEPTPQDEGFEQNEIESQLDGFEKNKTAPNFDIYNASKSVSQIDEYEPIDTESQIQSSSGSIQFRMSHVVCFTSIMLLWILSI